jgi:hypothetical protein
MMRDPAFHPIHQRVKEYTLRQMIYDDDIMSLLENAQTKLFSFDIPIFDLLDYVRAQQAEKRFVDVGELTWTSSLSKALGALDTYDFVGLMDHFEDCLLAMCEKFGFVPPDSMPELNRAPDEVDVSRELSERDIEHLRSFLSDDIQLYDAVNQRLKGLHADRQKIITDLFSNGVLRRVAGPLELDLSRPFAGASWYEPEDQGGRVARWSGPSSKAMLYLPLIRDVECTLQIEVLKPDFIPDVDVYVEQEIVQTRISHNEGRVMNLEVTLPKLSGARPPITTVVIDTKRVSQPSERHDGDLRALGLVLLSVKVL